jgi:starch synthase
MAPALSSLPSSTPRPLKILFVASECAPLVKSGGLGDVVGALPKSLRALGHDARVVLPLYSSIDRGKFGIRPARTASTCCVHMGAGEEQWVGISETMLDGVPISLIDCDKFFARPGLYGDPGGGEYLDNAYRFGLLSKAALQICKDRAWFPDVVHAHDWMSAPACAFLKTWDRFLSPLSRTASLLTIHNIGYQGVYSPDVMRYYGMGPEYFSPRVFEAHGQVNLLKGGIHFADAINTVSPTHAREILSPSGGIGLAPYLSDRSRDVFGVLNGADYSEWSPETDTLIPAPYSAANLEGKARCKAALQKRLGLEVRPDIPVVGIVSRFAAQKGFDLIMEALPRALGEMIFQVAVLGTGDRYTEEFFGWLFRTFPGARGQIGFSNELAHWIEAGSDFFLMPSLYEPCGLNQIYSLRYGTLPIVRATGGLEDTVHNYDEASASGTGFKFANADASSLYYTLGWAVSTWFDRPHHYRMLQQNAMAQHFGWDDSAPKYVEIYRHAMQNRAASV